METTHVNILDWSSARGYPLTPAALAQLHVPTLVVTGTASHPAPRRANEVLSQCVPGARLAVINGAAHFMIATHAGEVAGLAAEHVQRVEAS
jgi:pimeloyl-ACP methyl ester carboxylesterase